MNILFVCEGNMMRSQMGEAFYNHFTQTADAQSAGAAAMVGSSVPESIANAMRDKDISMEGMTGTQLTREMFDAADKVIAFPTPYMPRWVLDDSKTEYWDVSDPYYMPDDGTNYVERARDRIEDRVNDLISRTKTIKT